HRLEPIAHVGQSARGDLDHRVVYVRLTHLLVEVDVDNLKGGCFGHGLPHTSRLRAAWACVSMNFFRGGTALPINMLKVSSRCTRSSARTLSRVRVAGFIVVVHSCSGVISPRPL